MNNDTKFDFRMPEEDKILLTEKAKELGITLAGLLRMLYKQFLKKEANNG